MDQLIWFFLTSSPDAKTNSIDSMQISLTPGIDIKQKPDELTYSSTRNGSTQKSRSQSFWSLDH